MKVNPATEDTRLPAYLRLRDRLAARIAASEWQVEEALPSENVLARETGLSVGTVRRAIQQLVDEGLLERRQGSGTFLRKPAFEANLFRFFALHDRVEARTIPVSRLILRARKIAPAAVADILGTEACIRIDRLRLLGNDPVLFEEIWLPEAKFSGIETEPESAIGPLLYPFYLERYGIFIASADEEVSFASATKSVASRLGLEEGDPVAVIERTAFTVDGSPSEWRRAIGPAHRFRYRSRIG